MDPEKGSSQQMEKEKKEEVDKRTASASSVEEFKNNCKLYTAVLKNASVDLVTTLNNFKTWISWIDQGNGTPEYADYFYSVAIPEIGHAVLRRQIHPNLTEFVKNFLIDLLNVLLKRLNYLEGEFSDGEIELLLALMDPNNQFFTLYGHDLVTVSAPSSQNSGRTALHVGHDTDEEWNEWLDGLGAGDYALINPPYGDKWLPCRVVQVSPTNTEVEVEILSVGLLDIGAIITAEMEDGRLEIPVLEKTWFAKSSELFKQIGSAPNSSAAPTIDCEFEQKMVLLQEENKKLVDFSSLSETELWWRRSLSPGDCCDARTTDGEWFQAVVISVSSSKDSESMDELFIHFVGFSSQNDEVILRSAEFRLAPLNTSSEGRRGPSAPRSIDYVISECIVDDRNDPERKGAMCRSNKLLSTSKYLVECVNHFIQADGFDTVLQRASMSQPSIRLLRELILLVCRCVPYYTRSFMKYISGLYLPFVTRSVENLDASQVRLLNKGVVNDILSGVYRLLIRLHTRREAHSEMEKVALYLIAKRLESQAIMQRLDGMDSLTEIIERVNNAALYPSGLKLQARMSSISKVGRSLSADNVFGPQPQQKEALEARFSEVASAVASKAARLTGESMSKSTAQKSGEDSLASAEVVQEEKATSFDYITVPITLWLTEESLSKWILDQKIIEHAALGPLAHHELVKRCTKLIQLVAKKQLFDDPLADHLWEAILVSFGSDDEIVDAIYQLLGGALVLLPFPQLDHIVSLVEALSLSKYTSRTISFLGEVCKCQQQEKGSPRPAIRALDRLWVSMQQETNLEERLVLSSQQVLEAVVNHYASMDMMRAFGTIDQDTTEFPQGVVADSNAQTSLMKGILGIINIAAKASPFVDENGTLLREYLLEKCLDNIKQSRSVVVALQSLEYIVRSFPKQREIVSTLPPTTDQHLVGNESRERVLEWLESKHSILEACVEEVCDYANAATTSRSFEKGPLDSTYSSSASSFSKHVFGQLEWLSFAVSESSLTLSSNHVNMMWESLVIPERLPVTASRAFFRFLRHCVDTVSFISKIAEVDKNGCFNTAISEETMEEIFVKKLCVEKDLHIAGFVCFQAFFEKVNLVHGNLILEEGSGDSDSKTKGPFLDQSDTPDQPMSFKSVQVAQLPLLGWQELWKLALDSSDRTVAESAAQMLSHLQLRLSPSLKNQIHSERKSFIETCMSKMLEESKEAKAKGFCKVHGERTRRCLSLLRPFFEFTESEASQACDILQDEAWSQLEPHTACCYAELFSVTLNVNWKSSVFHGTKLGMCVSSNIPVWKFRAAIAKKLGLPAETKRLRLFLGGREIKSHQGVSLMRELNGMASGVTIVACERQQGASKGLENEPVSEDGIEALKTKARERLDDLPCMIFISDPKYFEQLFTVLEQYALVIAENAEELDETSDQIMAEIWHLLERLPSDRTIVKSLGDLSSGVETLFSKVDSSVFKWLYTLEMIEANFDPSPAILEFVLDVGGDKRCELEGLTTPGKLWCDNFARLGGFTHLIKGLEKFANDLASSSSVNRGGWDFRRSKIVEILGKLSRLLFNGVASQCFSNVNDGKPAVLWETALRCFPWIVHHVKVQKEFNLSGATISNPALLFPYNTLSEVLEVDVHPDSSTSGEPPLEQKDNNENITPPELTIARQSIQSFIESAKQLSGFPDWTTSDGSLLKDLLFSSGIIVQSVILSSELQLKNPELLKVRGKDLEKSLLSLCAWSVSLWTVTFLDLVLCSSVTSAEVMEQANEMFSQLTKGGLQQSGGSISFLVRQVSGNSLFALFRALQSTKTDIAELLLDVLFDGVAPAVDDGASSREYFTFCTKTVEVIDFRHEQGVELALNLVKLLRDRIVRTPVIELPIDQPPEQTDWVLAGRLGVICKLLESASRSNMLSTRSKLASDGGSFGVALMAFVLEFCLFGGGNSSYHCHRPSTRSAAFCLGSIVMNLCKYCPPVLNIITGFMSQLAKPDVASMAKQVIQGGDSFDRMVSEACSEKTNPEDKQSEVEKLSAWGIVASQDLRAKFGFAGIVNLGFICYMNSLIQQLFMIPRIRYGILSARTDSETGKENELLYELQKMFASLDLTVKQAYDPSGWCAVFKDESGQPVNVWQQQDAHEFFNTLCDRLDEILKGTEQGRVLTRAFGVGIANQLICIDESEDLELKRENDPVTEYCLTQEILSDRTNLRESLESFVAGEVLNDYKWEERGGKELRTRKRQCISSVNDVVVIHLKRFRLNWETFMTEKINSRFEFPLELDLFPYSKEGLEWEESRARHSTEMSSPDKYGLRGREYYQFRLSGIVVHSGASLNSGHYYSYIVSKLGTGKGKWFEFNDRVVKPFDIASLDESTFGGGVKHTSYGVEIPSVNNAYMVLYERICPLQDDLEFLNPSIGPVLQLEPVAARLRNGEVLDRSMQNLLFPDQIFKGLVNENKMIQNLMILFSSRLASFCCEVATSLKEVMKSDEYQTSCRDAENPQLCESVSNLTLALVQFSLNVLGRGTDYSVTRELLDLLESSFEWMPPLTALKCLGYLTDSGIFDGLMFVQTSEGLRDSFVSFTTHVFDVCTKHGVIENWDGLDAFCDMLCNPLTHKEWNWLYRMQYWRLLNGVTWGSPIARKKLIERKVVQSFADAFCASTLQIGQEGLWDNAFRCMESLILSVWPFRNEGDDEERFPPTLKTEQVVIPDENLMKTLFSRTFYNAVFILAASSLSHGQSVAFIHSLGRILAHISFGWKKFSVHAVQLMLQGIGMCTRKCFGIYFVILEELLSLRDGLEGTRIGLVAGSLTRDSTVPDSHSLADIFDQRCSSGEGDLLLSLDFVRFTLDLFAGSEYSVEYLLSNDENYSWKGYWEPRVELVLSRAEELVTIPKSTTQKGGEGAKEGERTQANEALLIAGRVQGLVSIFK